MEWLSWDCFSLGNVLLALFFLLILNQLIELYQCRNMPPGPRLTSLPFIGNMLSFDSTAPGDPLPDATKSLTKNYGTVFSLKMGSFKVVMAMDADSVKEVLVKRSGDFAGRPPFYSLLQFSMGGKNIVFGIYGPAWRFHRKLFMSAMRQYLSDQQMVEERMSEQAGRVLQCFEDQSGNDFNPSQILTESVANVICRIIFGKHFDSSHPDFEEFLRLNDDFVTDTAITAQNIVLDFFPYAQYLPFKSYRSTQKFVDRTFELLRKQLKAQERDFDSTDKIESFIGNLLKERVAATTGIDMEEKASLLSDDYILSLMEDIILGGYDTTRTALRWAIAFLVHHPEIQKQIQDQLDDVVGRVRMPGLDDRPNLPLVHATIMETLRLGNVAEVAIPHYTLKDTTLAGYRVPKDTVVIVNLQAVHQDPKCWEDPMTFNPQRHIDSNGQLITNSGNFLPFSAGRRVCAGESLAKVELFFFLSWMLHKFTFLPSDEGILPDLKGVSGFTRFPAPYKIRAMKR